MSEFNIICVDDQREVLSAVRKDLRVLGSSFEIVDCESAQEALEVLEELDAEGVYVPLIICDHVMPEQSGVDFLADMNKDMRFAKIKKLLLTGLATHEDTIRAINQAHIDRYMEKPWDKEELLKVVKALFTEYLLASGIDYQPYISLLDQNILYEHLRVQS